MKIEHRQAHGKEQTIAKRHTWWVHEVKVNEIINAKLFQVNDDRAQIGAQDFRVRIVLHLLLEGFLGVEAEALSGTRTTGATGALLSRGFADGRDEERLDSDARVVHLLLGKSWIDDENDTVDGQRCFGDVGADDHFAADSAVGSIGWSGLEDALLQVGRQSRVQRDAF